MNALFMACPDVANVSIISLLFFMIFWIIGVNYFKGKFFYCDDELPDASRDGEFLNKWDCINNGYIWKKYSYNFDSIENAMITLF